jgi:hypothetical protein
VQSVASIAVPSSSGSPRAFFQSIHNLISSAHRLVLSSPLGHPKLDLELEERALLCWLLILIHNTILEFELQDNKKAVERAAGCRGGRGRRACRSGGGTPTSSWTTGRVDTASARSICCLTRLHALAADTGARPTGRPRPHRIVWAAARLVTLRGAARRTQVLGWCMLSAPRSWLCTPWTPAATRSAHTSTTLACVACRTALGHGRIGSTPPTFPSVIMSHPDLRVNPNA